MGEVKDVAEQPVAQKLRVPFAGAGSGAAELTWGQQAVWRGVLGRGGPIWNTGVRPLDEGTTVQDVAHFISFVMGRHQSMRTTLRTQADPMLQVVHESGELELEIIDADEGADPLAIAKALEAEWLGSPLDFDTEWPVKIAVIRHRGVPVYRVMVIHHTVADGFGVTAMLNDYSARDPVTSEPAGPVTATQPLDEARWQTSPVGRRRSKMAAQYWERVLRAIPLRQFPEPEQKPAARYGHLEFISRAAYLALRVLADRTELDTSPVLLAAYCVGLAKVTGLNPTAPRMYVNNRFRPGLADSVSSIAQTAPCLVDVAGVSFDQAAKRAYLASLNAFKNAYFEPAAIREVLASVSEERGGLVDVNAVYNDRRMLTPREVAQARQESGGEVPGALPTPDEVRAALPLTTLTWEEKEDPQESCHVHILDAPDTITLVLINDNHYVARAIVEQVLSSMEQILVESACDPLTRTGI